MSHLYNIYCDVYTETISDDNYAGAVATGVLLYSHEPCRLDKYIPNQRTTLPQGLEVEKTYSLYIRSTRQHPINVRENDYFIITFPTYHEEFGQRLRIGGIQRESFHPANPINTLEITVVRIKTTRNNNVF